MSGKKVAVFNLKGGVGKSRAAINMALSYPWMGLITNDVNTDLEDYLEPDSFIRVEGGEQFPLMGTDDCCVYDLGGYIDQRAIEVLKSCDWVVIPTFYDLNDFKVTARSIREVEAYNQNIIVVLNRSEKGQSELFMDTFGGMGHPLLRIRKSEAIRCDMLNERKSVHLLASEGGLRGYHYSPVAEDFSRLFERLGLPAVDLGEEEACPKKTT